MFAGVYAVIGAEPVENAKPFDRTIARRHPARQALDGLASLHGHDFDVQRFCRAAFRKAYTGGMWLRIRATCCLVRACCSSMCLWR
jgi:hypothetical protein